jgi:hypothetical protein
LPSFLTLIGFFPRLIDNRYKTARVTLLHWQWRRAVGWAILQPISDAVFGWQVASSNGREGQVSAFDVAPFGLIRWPKAFFTVAWGSTPGASKRSPSFGRRSYSTVLTHRREYGRWPRKRLNATRCWGAAPGYGEGWPLAKHCLTTKCATSKVTAWEGEAPAEPQKRRPLTGGRGSRRAAEAATATQIGSAGPSLSPLRLARVETPPAKSKLVHQLC